MFEIVADVLSYFFPSSKPAPKEGGKIFDEYEPICTFPSEQSEHFSQPDLDSLAKWYQFVGDLPKHLKEGTIRSTIDELPDFPVKFMSKPDLIKYIRLAYVIVTFAINAYVREPFYQVARNEAAIRNRDKLLYLGPIDVTPLEYLPEKLAKPGLALGKAMNTAPLLSYQTVALYNFVKPTVSEPWGLNDFEIKFSLTGTEDEKYFYTIPLFIDYLGGFIRKTINDLFELAESAKDGMLSDEDQENIIAYLDDIRISCRDILPVMKRMPELCAVDEFMLFRVFYNGYKDDKIYPKGLKYGNNGETIVAHGASAAQSATLHMLSKFIVMYYCDFLADQFSMLHPEMQQIINGIADRAACFKKTFVNQRYPKIIKAFNKVVRAVVAIRDVHIGFVKTYIGNSDNQGTGGNDLGILKEIRHDAHEAKFRATAKKCPFLEKRRANILDQQLLTNSPHHKGSNNQIQQVPVSTKTHTSNFSSHSDRESDGSVPTKIFGQVMDDIERMALLPMDFVNLNL